MSVYHKRKPLDWAMLVVVGIIALVVILLSFKHTAELAHKLDLNPYLTAGLVELLFASLLFLRGRQRATQRNVPLFIHAGYFASFLFVTGVNVYGLYLKSPVVGPVVGIAISAAMWLMENTLVWLWTDSHQPHKKSLRERMKEAKREVKEQKLIQRIEYMKYEAKKPDLDLIREAREAEEERKRVEADGLPEFFRQKPEPVPAVVPEPVTIVQEPEPEPEQTAAVVPIRRPIGFHVESKQTKAPAPRFQANEQARAEALQTAKALYDELGRIPKPRELMQAGLSKHYAGWAREQLKNTGDGIE